MINFRRLALVSGIAVLSAVAVSPKAQAQSTNVDFSGNIPPTCTINSVTNGTLGLTTNQQILTTDAGSGGVHGILNVTCSAGTTFTIASVTDNGSTVNGASGLNGVETILARVFDSISSVIATNTVSISGGVIIPNAGSPGPVQTGPLTNIVYRPAVDVSNASTPLPGGSYKIRVNIALTPQ